MQRQPQQRATTITPWPSQPQPATVPNHGIRRKGPNRHITATGPGRPRGPVEVSIVRHRPGRCEKDALDVIIATGPGGLYTSVCHGPDEELWCQHGRDCYVPDWPSSMVKLWYDARSRLSMCHLTKSKGQSSAQWRSYMSWTHDGDMPKNHILLVTLKRHWEDIYHGQYESWFGVRLRSVRSVIKVALRIRLTDRHCRFQPQWRCIVEACQSHVPDNIREDRNEARTFRDGYLRRYVRYVRLRAGIRYETMARCFWYGDARHWHAVSDIAQGPVPKTITAWTLCIRGDEMWIIPAQDWLDLWIHWTFFCFYVTVDVIVFFLCLCKKREFVFALLQQYGMNVEWMWNECWIKSLYIYCIYCVYI